VQALLEKRVTFGDDPVPLGTVSWRSSLSAPARYRTISYIYPTYIRRVPTPCTTILVCDTAMITRMTGEPTLVDHSIFLCFGHCRLALIADWQIFNV